MEFRLFRDRAGEHWWALVAQNGRKIADSGEGYARKSGLHEAVSRLRAYAPESGVEDATQDPPAPVREGDGRATFRVSRDRAGKFRWNLIARNGEPIANSGHAYARKHDAVRSVEELQRQVLSAPLEDLLCPIYEVSPHVLSWGMKITLTVPAGALHNFGATEGTVSLEGTVPLASLTESQALVVESWSLHKVEAVLPAKPYLSPPYTLVVNTAHAQGCRQGLIGPVEPPPVEPPPVEPPPVEPPPVDLPPVEPPVLLPVPTVLALFEHQDFDGRLFVLVPEDSPIEGPGSLESELTKLANVAPDALGAVLAGRLQKLLAAVNDADWAPDRAKWERANRVTDFWDYEYQPFPWRVSAEDIMSSFVLIGEPGACVRLYNAPDLDEREGAFEACTDAGRVVSCRSLMRRSLADPLPETEPQGRLKLIRKPDFWKGVHYVHTFRDELSSMRFP